MIRCSRKRLVAIYICCIIALTFYANAFITTTTYLRCCCRALRPLNSETRSHTEDDVQIYPIDTLQIENNRNQPLVPDIAYYYLQKTIGLSEETMWKITLDAGSVLGMTPRNLAKKISLLRRTMNLSDDDVREILSKQPAILQLSADRNLAPTILLLVRALDLSKSELRSIIMACPSILGYSLENLKEKLSFFMNTLGYNRGDKDDGKDKVRNLFLQEPRLLSCGVASGLVPRMKFLHDEIQFSLKELRSLYQKSPRMLMHSLDSNLREKIVFFFILQIQMEPEHVRKLLMTYPQVMDYNLENHMKPLTEYCVTELEFSNVELRSIILRFPRLFTHSLFKVKHVVGFLRYELALDAQQVKRVIFQAPQIIGLDTEGNMKEKLNFLQQRIGLTQDELAKFIAKMPTLFSLNIETSLIPKFEYLEGCMGIDVLKEALLKQPVLLGYSLDRIQSRMKHLVAAGISPRKITVGISMTDDKFRQWVASSQSRLDLSQWDSAAVTYLCNSLEFTSEDIHVICSEVPHLPQSSALQVRSQISLVQEIFEDQDLDLPSMKSIVLKYPLLLDKSLKKQISERAKKLRLNGISPNENIKYLLCQDNDFGALMEPFISAPALKIPTPAPEPFRVMRRPILRTKRLKSDIAFIKELLSLNDTEAEVIISAKSLPIKYRSRLRAKIKYLLAQFDDELEIVKKLLLCHPELLDAPYSTLKRLEKMRFANILDLQIIGKVLLASNRQNRDLLQRIELINICKSPQSKMHSILFGSRRTAEELLFKIYLRNRLGFKSKEASSLFDTSVTKQPFLLKSLEKLNYLRTEAFNNSTTTLKQVLLASPEMLRLSLNRTIVPRVETIHYLQSLGYEYTPDDIGKLLVSNPSTFQKTLIPLAKTHTEALNDSAATLKQVLLASPEMLQLSLNRPTITPRADTIQYLESIGYKYTPDDIVNLLVSNSAEYQKMLIPFVKTWDKSKIKPKKSRKSENDIRAALQEHVQFPLILASSQDFNREDAIIVHWR